MNNESFGVHIYNNVLLTNQFLSKYFLSYRQTDIPPTRVKFPIGKYKEILTVLKKLQRRKRKEMRFATHDEKSTSLTNR